MLKKISIRQTPSSYFPSIKEENLPYFLLYQSFFIGVFTFLLHQLYDQFHSSFSPTPPLNSSSNCFYSFNLTRKEQGVILNTQNSYLTPQDFIQGIPHQNAIVSFVQKNEGLQYLMATAGLNLSKNLTFNQIKDAAYRFYEAKGRSVADAFDIITKNASSSFPSALEWFSGGFKVYPKQLRNILPTTSYTKPLTEGLKDYLGFVLVFQSILRQSLHSSPQASYRFGKIHNVYNGSFSPGPSLRFVSAAESQALFLPSYFMNCIFDNTLYLYLIKGTGAPIYEITDQNLRNISELGTREVVFPLGTTFTFLNQSESTITNLNFVEKIKDTAHKLSSSLVGIELENHATINFLSKDYLRADTDPVSTVREMLDHFYITDIKLVLVQATQQH